METVVFFFGNVFVFPFLLNNSVREKLTRFFKKLISRKCFDKKKKKFSFQGLLAGVFFLVLYFSIFALFVKALAFFFAKLRISLKYFLSNKFNIAKN